MNLVEPLFYATIAVAVLSIVVAIVFLLRDREDR
jgi:hypothetical protein